MNKARVIFQTPYSKPMMKANQKCRVQQVEVRRQQMKDKDERRIAEMQARQVDDVFVCIPQSQRRRERERACKRERGDVLSKCKHDRLLCVCVYVTISATNRERVSTRERGRQRVAEMQARQVDVVFVCIPQSRRRIERE